MQKHIEVKTYEHKGITVAVEIDYDEAKITLVEKSDNEFDTNQKTWLPRNWYFNNRGLEYMKGWKKILSAMEFAIDEASEELRVNNEARAAEREMAIGVVLATNDKI